MSSTVWYCAWVSVADVLYQLFVLCPAPLLLFCIITVTSTICLVPLCCDPIGSCGCMYYDDIACRWHEPYSMLPPCSRVLLEKLTGLQLVKKFSAFYRTWRFITAFTSSHHLSLSWASSIQYVPPHCTSWRSILILSSICTWVSPVASFTRVSPPKPCSRLSLPHTRCMPRPSDSSQFYHPHNIGWAVQNIKLLIM